jgi:SAM-dependent methyltransferase
MSLYKKLKQYKNKQDFEPGVLGLLINPFYFARKGLFQNVKTIAHHIKGRTLDVGCGQKPYQHLFNTAAYIGMDVDQPGHDHSNENIDVYYDGRNFPFENKAFDSIITSQVFEHVFTPEEFLKEINRVLRINGHLLITVPFVWDEHEQPYDYARYSSYGLKHVLEKNGFQVVEMKKSVNDIRVIFQLLNAYIFKKTVTKSGIINLILTIVLIAPFNIIGELLHLFLPKNGDLYLDNIFVVKKIVDA